MDWLRKRQMSLAIGVSHQGIKVVVAVTANWFTKDGWATKTALDILEAVPT